MSARHANVCETLLCMRGLLLVVFLVACSESNPEPTQPERQAEGEAEPDPATESESEDEPEVIPREDIGWTEAPAPPAVGASRANKRALRHHRSENYEAAAEGFRAALAETPHYLNARFNLACALTLSGELAEAKAEIETLWLQDLPTFGPRYDEDEDLALLRESEHGEVLTTTRAAILAGYVAAMERGAALVHQMSAEPREYVKRHYAQAGVWLHEAGRFVPMGPRVFSDRESDSTHSHVATVFHAAHRRVITATANSSMSDMSSLESIRVEAFVAPEGTSVGRHTIPSDREDNMVWSASIQSTPGGLRWQSSAERGRDGFIGPDGEADGPRLRLIPEAGSSWQWMGTATGVTVENNRRVRFGEGEEAVTAQLNRRHHNFRSDYGSVSFDSVVSDLGTTHVLVLTTTFIDLGMDGQGSGPFALSRVERASGDAELMDHGSGNAFMMQSDDAVYVQLDEVTKRFGTSGPATTLPSGLVISPSD